MIVYASTPRAARKRGEKGLGVFATPERLEWETPFGVMLPISAYALAANRHMATYGTTAEQLAQIAVDTRAWAATNPRAHLRDPHHCRRRARLGIPRRTRAQARMLPGDRRRRSGRASPAPSGPVIWPSRPSTSSAQPRRRRTR